MPDEVKPCPACGKSAIVRDFCGFITVECRFCGMGGPNGSTNQDAIAAWNDLPRAPQWTTYDGTPGTLPEPMTTVIIRAIHHCGPKGEQLQASGNLFDGAAALIWWIDGRGFVRLEVGDTWWPMPGGE